MAASKKTKPPPKRLPKLPSEAERAAKKPTGRPPAWTVERRAAAQDSICALISEGKSLRTICKMDGMPSIVTVFDWLDDDETFANRYARASTCRADALVEDLLDASEKAQSAVDNVQVQAARLKVDTLKWIASKMRPAKYGDKLELAGTLTTNKLSDEDLNAKIASLLGKAHQQAG